MRRIAGRYRYYRRECRQYEAADSNARPAADSAATSFIQWGKVVNHVADSIGGTDITSSPGDDVGGTDVVRSVIDNPLNRFGEIP